MTRALSPLDNSACPRCYPTHHVSDPCTSRVPTDLTRARACLASGVASGPTTHLRAALLEVDRLTAALAAGDDQARREHEALVAAREAIVRIGGRNTDLARRLESVLGPPDPAAEGEASR